MGAIAAALVESGETRDPCVVASRMWTRRAVTVVAEFSLSGLTMAAFARWLEATVGLRQNGDHYDHARELMNTSGLTIYLPMGEG